MQTKLKLTCFFKDILTYKSLKEQHLFDTFYQFNASLLNEWIVFILLLFCLFNCMNLNILGRQSYLSASLSKQYVKYSMYTVQYRQGLSAVQDVLKGLFTHISAKQCLSSVIYRVSNVLLMLPKNTESSYSQLLL